MSLQVPLDPQDRILAISSPEEGKNRSRKVVTRSKARSTSKYASWKMGRMTQCESEHELHAHRLLDANPEVLSFHEQPAVISYWLDGEEHDHYPDILVCLQTGKEFWEVKTKDDSRKPETVRRTQLMTKALPEWGYQYRLVLAEDLARKPRMDTVMAVLRWGVDVHPKLTHFEG